MVDYFSLRTLKQLCVALRLQFVLGLWFLTVAVVSVVYWLIGDARFAVEVPLIPLMFSIASFVLSYLWYRWLRRMDAIAHLRIRDGIMIVAFTWIVACMISAIYFVMYGFPDPAWSFEWYRMFIDGFFESMSGFTTTGSSILLSVEIFPRSLLYFRSLMHWIGGMGIAFMSATVVRELIVERETILNAESEWPNYTTFKDESQAVMAGRDFFKAYGLLTAVMLVLMIVACVWFRQVPYVHWYDAIYDAINYTFSVMGTGWFGTYDTSAGLPLVQQAWWYIIGGLQNPVAEWIMAIFMVVAGMNFGVFYSLIFTKIWWRSLRNRELQWYLWVVWAATLWITAVLWDHQYYVGGLWETLRYALFSVASIISTTGLANRDFTLRPTAAISLLVIVYLTWWCVWSTAGWLKILRFQVIYAYMRQIARKIANNEYMSKATEMFYIDGIWYSGKIAALILMTIVIYVICVMAGSLIIMMDDLVDFGTAFAVSLASIVRSDLPLW